MNHRQSKSKQGGTAAACLSPRQMQAYLGPQMLAEERHAIEVHLISCPLCNHALAGLKNHPEALQHLNQLNRHFLKEHFGLQHPQIQMSALASAAPRPRRRWARLRKRAQREMEGGGSTGFWVTMLVMGAAIAAYFYAGRPSWEDIRAKLYQNVPPGEIHAPQDPDPGSPSEGLVFSDSHSSDSQEAEPIATQNPKNQGADQNAASTHPLGGLPSEGSPD